MNNIKHQDLKSLRSKRRSMVHTSDNPNALWFPNLINEHLDQLPANDLFQDNMDTKFDLGIDNSVPRSDSFDFDRDNSSYDVSTGDY